MVCIVMCVVICVVMCSNVWSNQETSRAPNGWEQTHKKKKKKKEKWDHSRAARQRIRKQEKEIKKTGKVFTASCLLSGPLTPSYIMLTEKEINIKIKGFFCGVCPCLILKQQYLKRNLLFKYKSYWTTSTNSTQGLIQLQSSLLGCEIPFSELQSRKESCGLPLHWLWTKSTPTWQFYATVASVISQRSGTRHFCATKTCQYHPGSHRNFFSSFK